MGTIASRPASAQNSTSVWRESATSQTPRPAEQEPLLGAHPHRNQPTAVASSFWHRNAATTAPASAPHVLLRKINFMHGLTHHLAPGAVHPAATRHAAHPTRPVRLTPGDLLAQSLSASGVQIGLGVITLAAAIDRFVSHGPTPLNPSGERDAGTGWGLVALTVLLAFPIGAVAGNNLFCLSAMTKSWAYAPLNKHPELATLGGLAAFTGAWVGMVAAAKKAWQLPPSGTPNFADIAADKGNIGDAVLFFGLTASACAWYWGSALAAVAGSAFDRRSAPPANNEHSDQLA